MLRIGAGSDPRFSAKIRLTMGKIHKLNQKVIDQIAAGEVVERPASVLKELIENSIDADARDINIKIENGGMSLIEVIDDGVGISKGDLGLCLDSHSTSKIKEIEDIINIDTLGFRGEALSSISVVSRVCILSRESGSSKTGGNMIEVKGGDKSAIKTTSRDNGTTVVVEDIFYNIPARKKFLKSPRTEYRKILDVFLPIALINPNVHFVLENDGKQVYNLPAIKDSQKGTVHPQRLKSLIKDVEFFPVFYDGEGITIGGYIGHPKHFSKRVSEQYIFVNGRNIWDFGIVKSVSLGARRFIPKGTKIPFVISINILPRLVDVNVHPRKSEIRFLNPYRVYSAVEMSVNKALGSVSKTDKENRDELFRVDQEEKQRPDIGHDESRAELFRSGKDYDVDESMEFSRIILQDSDVDEYKASFKGDNGAVVQLLNRYIVTEKDGDILIIDQHAAAERIRFEKLLQEYSGKGVESQSMLVPIQLDITASDREFIKEYIKALRWFGFEFDINKKVSVKAIPSLLSGADISLLVKDVIERLKDVEEFENKDQILSGEYKDSVIAIMACHSSVRANKKISKLEAKQILEDLSKCENAYSCPHGRPIVWKLNPSEIDKHFNRT